MPWWLLKISAEWGEGWIFKKKYIGFLSWGAEHTQVCFQAWLLILYYVISSAWNIVQAKEIGSADLKIRTLPILLSLCLFFEHLNKFISQYISFIYIKYLTNDDLTF